MTISKLHFSPTNFGDLFYEEMTNEFEKSSKLSKKIFLVYYIRMSFNVPPLLGPMCSIVLELLYFFCIFFYFPYYGLIMHYILLLHLIFVMVHIFISPDLYIPDKQFHPLSFLALLFNPGCWVLPNNKLTHNTNVLLSRTLSAFKL